MKGADRYVVLGLAHPRAGWFSELSRWATSAAVPVEFVKCVSADEVRARLAGGRAFSALLVDGDLSTLDRDLVDEGRTNGAAVIVVGGRAERAWDDLGVSAVLPSPFSRTELLATLTEHATPIARVDQLPITEDPTHEAETTWRGRLIAVTGPGGAGSSIAAMAIAQGLGADASNRGVVALADLALHGDLAMLHDAQDVVPGLQELVEAHRGGRLPLDEIRAMVFDAVGRDYHLLLGLRRHRDWTAIRPRALGAALDGLLRAYRLVVADIDPDLEGEHATGSIDVEDRNLLARSAIARADVVVVVGTHGLKGMHSLVRTVHELLDAETPAMRVLPVVNRAPRSPRRRAEIIAAFAELTGRLDGADAIGNPVLVPDRRDLEDALVDGVRLPQPLVRPIVHAVQRRLDAADPRGDEAAPDEPVAVVPGSLGSWTEEAG